MRRLRTVRGEIYLRPYVKYGCRRAELHETHVAVQIFVGTPI